MPCPVPPIAIPPKVRARSSITNSPAPAPKVSVPKMPASRIPATKPGGPAACRHPRSKARQPRIRTSPRASKAQQSGKIIDMPATPDDDDFKPGEDVFDPAPQPQTLSEMVRESPIGALIGAFVAGFLVARLL